MTLVLSPGGDSTVQREKEASGLADVPGGSKGKLLEVEYAFTEDRKLRGQLRDPGAIEAQVGSNSGQQEQRGQQRQGG